MCRIGEKGKAGDPIGHVREIVELDRKISEIIQLSESTLSEDAAREIKKIIKWDISRVIDNELPKPAGAEGILKQREEWSCLREKVFELENLIDDMQRKMINRVYGESWIEKNQHVQPVPHRM